MARFLRFLYFRWRMTLLEVQAAIAAKISTRLTELGINRQEFAYAMGVQPSSVTKWLKGAHNFEMKTLFKIERVLQMSLVNLCAEKSPIPESLLDQYAGWV